MEYTVNKLAQMSGVSTRTLRFYDEIGLLKPVRVNSNNYRIYGQKDVDALQQILLYRELGVSLDEIKSMLTDPAYNREETLQNHLTTLLIKKAQIETLIKNVSKTIDAMKGVTTMTDKEKFEGFKQSMISDNEKKYGKEIREKYGDDVVNESNVKIKGMSKEDYDTAERLSTEIGEKLKLAVAKGNPSGELAKDVCELHKQWLCMFWKEGMYSKEAHKELGEMYVADERFKAYYDKITDGGAEFLRDALKAYCEE